jgi:predicted nucleic acid-binding protein
MAGAVLISAPVAELAVNGRATCIVSGDADLLAMNPFRGIPILTPKQFLDATAAG